ncbi:restriction endonuclease subunit S [Acidithiobacillus ferrianus]|uniref:Restriction endonuclease subunit S n=2 Tax=Acidithiobacillus ferrianus TaxID=2678518 RepID=A0A845U8Y9_9PROT|nr:restriction endonuclease subunit S [Acidithiobacillus ferrianus]NDU43313.1 restriction endonuclease subunit S [Acidithiobacillus ferrianus]
MVGKWREVTLGEIAEIYDGPHATPKKTDDGPIFLGISNISRGRLDLSNTEHVSENDFHRWTRRVEPEEGDVVFSYETRLGEAARVPHGLRCCLGRRMGLLRARGGLVDPRFLLYAYLGPDFQDTLYSRTVHGSTVDRIPLINMPHFPIVIPGNIQEQRRIAHILGTLDDRIENNRKTAKTLEAMAQAIFKSWFVDFDPVRAKMAGESQESICKRLKLTPEILDLFPDRLVDSELGEIPEGWRVGKLGDVAEHPRRSVQPNSIEPDRAYIALEHMPKRSIALFDWGIANGLESNKFEFKKGEILFGKLRPYFHKVGIAPLDGVCSTDIVVVAPRSADWFAFVLAHVSSNNLVEYANVGSTGTKMPRTSWTDMARYNIATPPKTVARVFSEMLLPSIDRIIVGIHESRTLAAIRDDLLPKLISGEIRVPDVQTMVHTAIGTIQ